MQRLLGASTLGLSILASTTHNLNLWAKIITARTQRFKDQCRPKQGIQKIVFSPSDRFP